MIGKYLKRWCNKLNTLSIVRNGERFKFVEQLESRELLSGTQYVVDSLLDVVATDGVVTLREAIQAANENRVVSGDLPAGSSSETDRITFSEALLQSGPVSITLGGTQLVISEDLDIEGPGDEMLSINGDARSRILTVRDGARAHLSGLTMTKGQINDPGAAIWNWSSHVTLEQVTLSNNISFANGGAIYNSGTLNILNSTLTENMAHGKPANAGPGGGAIYDYTGRIYIFDSTFSNNVTLNGRGGAINFTDSTVTIVESIFSGNAADYPDDGWGGAVYSNSGTFRVKNAIFHDNSASAGGGLYLGTGDIDIVNTLVHHNKAQYGGGIYRVSAGISLVNTVIVGNTAERGGGYYNERGGAHHLRNVTITGNSANIGGGIYLEKTGANLNNSIVAFNQASVSDIDIYGEVVNNRSLVGIDPKFYRNADDGGDGWGDNEDTPGVDESENDDLGDLRLLITSPGIDYGDNRLLPNDVTDLDGDSNTSETLPLDIYGNPRIYDGVIDVGAIEFIQPQGGIEVSLAGMGDMIESYQFEVTGVGNTATVNFVVHNTGDEQLRVSEIKGLQAPFSSNAGNGPGSDDDWIIEPDQSRLFTVSFSPSFAGNYFSNLLLISDDPDIPVYTLGLSGLEKASAGTTYIVNSTADTVEDDGMLTLREAILAANSNFRVNEAAAGSESFTDEITFSPELYQGGPASILLSGTELEITEDLNIHGPGQESVMVDANGSSRVFNISDSDVDVVINGITIAGGAISGSRANGGGIHNLGELLLLNSTVRDSYAQGHGGGVYNESLLTMQNSLLMGNDAGMWGGGLANLGTLVEVYDCIIQGNHSNNVGGGLFNARSTIIIDNTLFADNSADEDGGAIHNNNLESILTITDTEFIGNSADQGGGVYLRGELHLHNSTFKLNRANWGGALSTWGFGEITNSVIVGNTARWDGGGVRNRGVLEITSSTIAGNVAMRNSGGVHTRLERLTLNNTLIASNYAGNAQNDFTAEDPSLLINHSSLVGLNAFFVRDPDDGGDGWGDDPLTLMIDESLNDDFGDLNLTGSSPGLNTGDNTYIPVDIYDDDNDNDTTELIPYDYGDRPRVANDIVDVGAYESDAIPKRSDIAVSIRGVTDHASQYDFGAVEIGNSESIVLRITNEGNDTLVVNRLSGLSAPFSVVPTNEAGTTDDFHIAPNEYQDVTVTYDAIFGYHEQIIQIDSNDADEPVYLVNLAAGDAQTSGTRYVVTSLLDQVGNDGELTLREAIEASNTNMNYYDALAGSSMYGDYIEFDPVLFESGPRRIVLQSGSLEIYDGLTVMGPGSELLTIDADRRNSRVVYIDAENSDIYLNHMTFTGGRHADGLLGIGIYNRRGTLTMKGAVVRDNINTVPGGGITNSDTLILIDTIVRDNDADFQGGGILNNGTGDIILINSEVSNNDADVEGGGIYVDRGTLTIYNSKIFNNYSWRGAGIYGDFRSKITINNSVISKNRASSGGGGGVFSYRGDVYVNNSTITDNRSTGSTGEEEGSAGGVDVYDGTFEINNSIITFNQGPDGDVFGEYTGSHNIIGGNPLFVNFSAGDYHLREESPAVDAGDNNLVPLDEYDIDGDRNYFEKLPYDIDGNPRFAGTVDIGAYELLAGEIQVQIEGLEAGENAYDFGAVPVGESRSVIITVSNVGTGVLNVDPSEPMGPFKLSRVNGANTLEVDIDPGAFMRYMVTYEPVDDYFMHDRMFFSSTDPNTSEYAVKFTGGNRAENGTRFVVDSLLDIVADDDVVTLREALQSANTNTSVTPDVAAGSAEHVDLIQFHPDLFNNGAIEIVLSGIRIDVTDDVVLESPGARMVKINGDDKSSVLSIAGPDIKVEMMGFVFTGGNNMMGSGGGVTVEHAEVVFDQVVVSGNHSGQSGGGIFNASGQLSIRDSMIEGNTASYRGGGIISSAEITLINSTIQGNHSMDAGGGIFNDQMASTSIVNSRVSGNTGLNGGGIYIDSNSSLGIVNTIIDGNESSQQGGGIYNASNDDDSVFISSTTITDNLAGGVGGGIYIMDDALTQLLSNSIVSLNTGLVGTDIFGAYTSHGNLIGVDPKFAYPEDGDYRLLVDSPAVNMGDNAYIAQDEHDLDKDGNTNETVPIDISGNSRVIEGRIDVGAHEGVLLVGAIEVVSPDGQINPDNIALIESPVDSIAQVIFTVENKGEGVLTITEVSGLSGPLSVVPTNGQSELDDWRISPGGSFDFMVQYKPSVVEPITQTMLISSDDPHQRYYEIDLAASSYVQYLVNSLGVHVVSDGQVTLREAIHAANSNTAPTSDAIAGSTIVPDRIVFDPALFTEGPATIVLSDGVLEITESLNIQGVGSDMLTIDANQSSRLFKLVGAGQSVKLSGMSLTGGTAPNAQGGAVFNHDMTVSLIDMRIHGNRASGRFGEAGGIYNFSGDVTLINSVMSNNASESTGGAVGNSGTMTMVNSVVIGNNAFQGGGIVNSGQLTLVNSTVSGNTAVIGGGINTLNSNLTINNSIVTLNEALVSPDIVGIYSTLHSLIDGDPQFMLNPDSGGDGYGDNLLTPGVDESLNDDYGDLTLQAGSDAIDAGENSLVAIDDFDLDGDDDVSEMMPVDLSGLKRISGSVVDLGAYEYQYPPMPLRVTEIYFDDPVDDNAAFIEIMNVSDELLSLVGVLLQINNQHAYEFLEQDANLILQAGQRLVIPVHFPTFVVNHPEVPASYYSNRTYIDHYETNRNTIALLASSGEVIQAFSFSADDVPLADGLGASLTIIDPHGSLDQWDEPSAWKPSGLDSGTPGRPDPVGHAIPGDSNYDGYVNLVDLSLLAAHFGDSRRVDPEADIRWMHGDYNADGAVNLLDLAILADHFQQPGFNGFGSSEIGEIEVPSPIQALLLNEEGDSSIEDEVDWHHIGDLLNDDEDRVV